MLKFTSWVVCLINYWLCVECLSVRLLHTKVHTYVNTTGVQEERRSRSSVHAPLDLRLSNPESLVPSSPNEASEARVLLEPEGVKFVLGPTPVQRQLMAKERQREVGEHGGGDTQSSVMGPSGEPAGAPLPPPSALNGLAAPPLGTSADCDTGYDSDERKETPSSSSTVSSSATSATSGSAGAKLSAYEHHNGTASTHNPTPTTADPSTNPPPLTLKTTLAPATTTPTTTTISTGARRCRPPIPTPDAQNANNSAQRRTALLNYENLPALPPVWEVRKPYPETGRGGDEEEEENNSYAPKTPSLNNGYHHHHHHHSHHHHPPQHTPHPLVLHHGSGLDPMHNYVNTENVTVPLSAHKPDSARPPRRDCSSSQQPTVFNFDFRRGVGAAGVALPEPLRQLNYIEVEMEKGSDSSGPHTPKTPTTPLPQTPTRRTELYAVIDIERTAAMSSLQKALPRDDGTSRKTRHNSTDLPM